MRSDLRAEPAEQMDRGLTGSPRLVLLMLVILAPGCVLLAPGSVPAQAADSALAEWFPRLRVGMWVKVEGGRNPEGVLEATKIKIHDGELDEVEIESHVAEVDLVHTTLVTTLGVRVVANPSTKLKGPKQQRQVSFAFLEAGDRIDVEGQLQKDGSLLAEELDIEKSKRLRPDLELENKHELAARIESIDADKRRVVLLGIPVQLSERTRNKNPLD